MIVPIEFYDKIMITYGCDKWFFIKHPKLDYVSPYIYLKTGGKIKTVTDLILEDTDGLDKQLKENRKRRRKNCR